MFEVGKEIYCQKSHDIGRYIKGETYILQGIKEGCKHYPQLISIGKTPPNTVTHCTTCGENFEGDICWDSRNFVPIDSISLSQVDEILAKEPFEI